MNITDFEIWNIFSLYQINWIIGSVCKIGTQFLLSVNYCTCPSVCRCNIHSLQMIFKAGLYTISQLLFFLTSINITSWKFLTSQFTFLHVCLFSQDISTDLTKWMFIYYIVLFFLSNSNSITWIEWIF